MLLHSNTVANTDNFAANRSTCMLHTADESKLCLHKCKAMQSIGRGSKAVSTYKRCSNYAAFEVRARHFEASVEAVNTQTLIMNLQMLRRLQIATASKHKEYQR